MNLALALFGAALLGVARIELDNPWFNDVPWVAIVPLGLAVWARKRRPQAGMALLMALLWAWTARSPSEKAAAKLVVLGVDGATFDVIDQQALPAFEALGRDGARATLTSMEPMFSPLLWTTMASGRPPEEHGVRGFHVQAPDCKVARFWDVAEHEGHRIGLYKWLVDYPPREVQGFWVPSWLAPAPDAWPPALSAVKELELSKRMRRKRVEATRSSPELAIALAKVGVRMSTLARAVAWSVEERVTRPQPHRANVAMQMLRGRIDHDVFLAQLHLERPDVATFTYYATDGLAHLYWDHPDVIRDAYRQADGILADVRDALGPDARLVVVSDHGFKAMDGTGLAGQFAPLTERLQARMTEAAGKVDVTRVGHKLTVAAERPDDARAFLATLTDATGAPFYVVEDTPGGTLGLSLADEQITAERLRRETVGGEPLTHYVKLTDAYTGTHEPRGVFFAAGPGVTPGARLPDVALLDVAPTILAAMGLPASDEMKGRAVVWPEAPRVASWDHLVPTLRFLGGEAGVNDEMLKQLGYVQ